MDEKDQAGNKFFGKLSEPPTTTKSGLFLFLPRLPEAAVLHHNGGFENLSGTGFSSNRDTD